MRFGIPAVLTFAATALAAPAPGTSPSNTLQARGTGQCSQNAGYVFADQRLSDKYLWLKGDSCSQGHWDLKGFQVEALKADLKREYQAAVSPATQFYGCIHHGWLNRGGGPWAAEMILRLEAGWDKSWIPNTEIDAIIERFWNYRAENGKWANFWTEIWRDGHGDTARVGWIQFYGRDLGDTNLPGHCQWVE